MLLRISGFFFQLKQVCIGLRLRIEKISLEIPVARSLCLNFSPNKHFFLAVYAYVNHALAAMEQFFYSLNLSAIVADLLALLGKQWRNFLIVMNSR